MKCIAKVGEDPDLGTCWIVENEEGETVTVEGRTTTLQLKPLLEDLFDVEYVELEIA